MDKGPAITTVVISMPTKNREDRIRIMGKLLSKVSGKSELINEVWKGVVTDRVIDQFCCVGFIE